MSDLPMDRRLEWRMPTPETADGRPTARDIRLEDSDLKRKIIKGAKVATVTVAAFAGVTEAGLHIGNDELQVIVQYGESLAAIGALAYFSRQAIHAVETGHPD